MKLFLVSLPLLLLIACAGPDGVSNDDAVGHDADDQVGADTVIGDPDGVQTDTPPIGDTSPDVGSDIVISSCETNEDCPEGVCVPTKYGKQCSTPCLEDCAAGWSCKPLPSGRDDTWVCVPDHITTCRPCATHIDCQEAGFQPGGICREFGALEGSFCATPCGESIDCLAGYDCAALEGGGTYCLPTDGTCECDAVATDRQLSTPCVLENDLGACAGERVCAAAGLTGCDASTPVDELCDGVDQDCDGVTDEGDPEGGGACQAEGQRGACGAGTLHCQDGALTCTPDGAGAPEACNGLDDDCDGMTDEKGADGCTTYYLDKDGDDYGVASALECLCAPNGQYTAVEAGDCDDLEAAANPAADEICDGVDNNCDGVTDPPGIPGTEKYYTDGDGDGYSGGLVSAFLCAATQSHPTQLTGDCDDGDSDVHPAADEVCDGKDNDCDGGVDGPDAEVACTTNCGFGVQACVGGLLLPCGAPPENTCTNFSDCATYLTCEPCPDTPPDDQCDGVDDDCDGIPDDAATLTLLDGAEIVGPDQACGAGVCAGGTTVCSGGALICPSEDLADAETCNDADDDCDGEIDEGLLQAVWYDNDEDGFGDPDVTQDVCVGPDGWVANALDCDDTDPAIHPGTEEVCDGKDNDCNGVVDQVAEACDLGCAVGSRICVGGEWGPCDAPSPQSCMDYSTCQYQVICITECPPAPEELCNGEDDDCDGQVDEGLEQLFYLDGDGDGFGVEGATTAGCSPPAGYAEVAGDCDDNDPGSYPGAVEICDGNDNDCDGPADEELGEATCGQGPCLHSEPSCVNGQPKGCDPYLGAVSEACDGVDNDCNGAVDDGNPGAGGGCQIQGLLGLCAQGVLQCQGGQLQCAQTTWPQNEVCNGQDDDCDGVPDDGDPGGGVSCQVPGKQGPCAGGIQHCQNGAPVCTQTIFPVGESCNGADDDCDGTPDDGNPGGGGACSIAWLSGPCKTGQWQCQGGSLQCQQTVYPTSETCNNVDDDCNGQVDGYTDSCNNGCNTGTKTCSWGGWSSCNAPPPACTSGPCCDGCDYRSSSTKCDSSPSATQYQCTESDLCGGAAQRRYQYKYCTGNSSTCGTSNLQWDSWTTLATCSGDKPCYASSSTAYCKSACAAGYGCQNGQCEATFYCGDGNCDAGETPSNCPNDCAPVYVDTQRWQLTNGGCTSDTDGWHPAGGIVYWSYGTSCSLPSTSNPESYSQEFARWRFTIKKTGHYRIKVKIPPAGAACNFPNWKYTTGARYILDRPGATNSLHNLNMQANIGNEVTLVSDVQLGPGTMKLYLYDSVSDLTNCCDTCYQSIRVFLDYAKVEWLYE
ncbi:MAG: putative metal-binding motif-containing protein [Pseudomonadota bacterium]